MLRYQEGSASTEAREQGFLEALKAFPGIEVISSDQHAGPTRDTAKRASENLLNRYGREVQGVFAVNESSAAGMLLALQDLGRAGKVSFVGFDSPPGVPRRDEARRDERVRRCRTRSTWAIAR